MKTSNLTFASILLCFVLFIAGCGALQRALFTTTATVNATTNAAPAGMIKPNPAAVAVIQDTGAAFGPYGTAAAGLLTGALSLYANWRNRKSLQAHLREKHPVTAPGA